MSFSSDMEAFVKKAVAKANASVNTVVEDLFTSIVVNSPSPSNPGLYANGLLSNQWWPQLNTPSSQVTSATNPNGADSLSRIKSLLGGKHFYGKDSVITLTNNTEQAYRAEYLGWPRGGSTNGWVWSGRVGPYLMVNKSVQQLKGKYT